MENLNKNIAFVGINCNNAVNSFQQIALTKFVEIDIEELPKENNKITEDKNIITKEEKDQKLLNSLKNSICISLNNLNLKNTNPVNKKKIKLPFIIGTEDFFNNEDLGIKDDKEEMIEESKVIDEAKKEEEQKNIEPIKKEENKIPEKKENILPQIGGIFPNKKPTLFDGVFFSDEEDNIVPEKKVASKKGEEKKEENENKGDNKLKIQLEKFIKKGLFDIEDDDEEDYVKSKIDEPKNKDIEKKEEIKSESIEIKKGLQTKNNEKKNENIFDFKEKENSFFKEKKKNAQNKQEKAERLLFRMFEEDDEDEEKNKDDNKKIEDIQTKTQDFALKISNILNETNADKKTIENKAKTFKKPFFLEEDDSDQDNYQKIILSKKEITESSLINKEINTKIKKKEEQKNTQDNINKLKDILGERFASASGSGESPFILPQKKKEIPVPEMNLSSPNNAEIKKEKELVLPILKKKKPKKPNQFLLNSNQPKIEEKSNQKKVKKGKSKEKNNKPKEEKKKMLFIFEDEKEDKNNKSIKTTQIKKPMNNEGKKPKKIKFDFTFDDD